MNIDDKYAVEDLKMKLASVKQRREKVEKELEVLKAEEANILKELASLSTTAYEEDMLAKVYAQRHR